MSESSKDELIDAQKQVIGILFEVIKRLQANNDLDEEYFQIISKEDKNDIRIDEIEFWFENEGSWTTREPRIRITNLANYVQDKYQQTAHLRIISDDDCGCGN